MHLTEVKRRLEFDKVVEVLKRKTLSQDATDRFDDQPFLTSRFEVETALSRVEEFAGLLSQDSAFPLEIWELRDDLEIIAVPGAVLSCDGLIRVANTLSTVRRIYGYLKSRQQKCPELWRIAQQGHLLQDLEEVVAEKIDFREAIVKDSASPKLRQLRRDIQAIEQRARKALEKLFREVADEGYLQDANLTLRDGRLVFPVRVEHKGKIKGLVHDQSATGATVFIEPLQSIEFNNEIQSLKREEQREVERILRELTALLHPQLEEIIANLGILVTFDFIQAKAKFALEFDCAKPTFNEKSTVEIIQGRHPLLVLHIKEAQAIVPLDMKLDESLRTLVITGPNAGGKSVALKTVGLLALMAQSGIPIPAHPDSSLPLFDEIFADIGDFQSIEHDLSTFSSHVRYIKQVLQRATEHSLVLLDEIGVGTDPDEGAALAITLLEELTGRGAKTIVTTHHGKIKAFAFDTPGVQNGSMEFDSRTLQPVFKFKAGIPGSSYALEISRRLGLPEPLLARSKELLGSEKHDLQALILDLEKKIQHSEKLTQELDLERTRINGLTKLYQEKLDAFKQEERALKKKALQESQELLARSNTLIEQAVREIRESQAEQTAVRQAREALETQKQRLDKQLAEVEKSARPEPEESGPVQLEPGAEAFWTPQRKTGTIISLGDNATKALLQIENLKVWVATEELAAPPRKKERARPTGSVRVEAEGKDEVLPQIDVRGQNLEDATSTVDKFIDDALLAGWAQVRIIHGKGTGVLRKGLGTFLDKHTHVKNHKMGAWNEGDLGVTIVELD